MKELSIEQKAKAYDKALERAKEKYTTCYSPALLDYIFPELKEDDGEKSKKWILEYLYDGLRKSDEQFKDHFKTAIAWLKKQNPNANKEYWRGYREGKQEILDKYAELEKQGEQEFIDSDTLIQQRVDTLADIDAKQSSADNVKPKVKNEIEIPFGAKDSELQEATYYIPKGFYAEIDNDKVVIKKGNKEDESWFKEIELMCLNFSNDTDYREEFFTWLKSIKDRVGCEVNCTTTKEWSEEDERIKKRLINLVNEVYDNTNYITFLEHKELLAWLEKRDKNNKPLYIRFGDIPKNEKSKVYNGEIEIGTEKGVSVYPAFEDLEGNIVLGLSLPITKTTLYTQQHLIEYDDRPCYLVTGDYIGKDTDGQPLINNVSIIEKIDTYRVKEKMQSEQKVRCTALMETGNGGIKALVTRELPINSCDDEQKPADEPKFHKGDWIVSPDNLVCKITQANSHSYTLHLYNDDYRIFDTESWHIDKKYHLWTIQDAKEGDVLATDKSVFIYAKILYNKPYAYCGVDKYGVFKNNCLENNWTNSVDNIHPATKEQRDTLMKAMTDAGYTWDAEKKELKKLGQSEVTKTSGQEIGIAEIPFGAKDSELQEATYHIPKGFHAEIDDDKVVIKKGEKPTVLNEDSERIRKRLINLVNEVYNNTDYITFLEHKELLTWLEKLDDNIEL